MTVRRSGEGTIILEGACPVEDAEPLLQMLQMTPEVAIDWTQCDHLHTAVFQIIVAAGVVPAGRCGDAWLQQWIVKNPS